MTQEEFWKELSNIKGWAWKTKTRRKDGWGPIFEEYKALRRDGECEECPITAVANQHAKTHKTNPENLTFNTSVPLDAINYLGLDEDWAQDLIYAADGFVDRDLKPLRKKLDKVCKRK